MTKLKFSPWEVPSAILANAGIELGINYPNPIVDLSLSQQQVLETFASLKG